MNTIREPYAASDTRSISRIRQPVMTFPGSTRPDRSALQPQQLFQPQQSSASTQLKGLKHYQRQKIARASTERHESSVELSSTICAIELYSKVEAIFWAAKREFFEDGTESVFSRQLNSFVREYGNDLMEAITYLIVYERVNPEVAGEALRWLGRIEHSGSYNYRLWLLERSLRLSSARVKDGAILGLASMDDKDAIPYLKVAIEQEQCSELKADMEQVLEQLEN
jgi:hypothetical protein